MFPPAVVPLQIGGGGGGGGGGGAEVVVVYQGTGKDSLIVSTQPQCTDPGSVYWQCV